MRFWPLQNLTPSQLNRSGRQALGKFFENYRLASPNQLRLWHSDTACTLRRTPLTKLIGSESRELYLLAMFAEVPFPELEYGYYLAYEWCNVGSALTELDITRIKVAHPGVTNIDQLIQQAISNGFDAAGQCQTLFEWQSFHNGMMRQQKRRLFGYESVVQSLTIRALAFHAGTMEEDTLQTGISEEACLAITSFNSPHEATAAGLEDLKEAISTLNVTERQPQHWKHAVIRRFSGLYAHLWLYQGHELDDIVARLRLRLELLVTSLFDGITQAQKVAIVRSTMANFVACYPSAWAIAGLEPGDFLGCSLLDRELYDDQVRQTHESAFDSFVRKGDEGVTFPKLALDYLGKIDERIYSPEYVDREGSRSKYWNTKVVDLRGSETKVNALIQKGIWHPVMIGSKVVDMLDVESAIEVVRAYMDRGGNAAASQARKMIQRYPQLVDQFVGTVTKRSEVGRLASVANLAPAQIERIPEAFRDTVLAVDLGL